jgi:hypothetical protein
MSNNYIKKALSFNLIVGFTGIFILWMLVLLMRATKKFVNIFFLLPHIVIYMFVLNVGFYLIFKYSEKIEKMLGINYSLKKIYLPSCIIINFLLGIIMIFGYSLYGKGFSSR